MKTKLLHIAFTLLMIVSSVNSNAQDSSSVKKHSRVKSISDIPHNTAYEKWMWIHRSIAFQITRERPVTYDTAYIKSYYKRLVITLPVSARFLKFSLIDLKSGNKLTFVPNIQYNLGISISSRWASFIFNTGVQLNKKDTYNKGTTKYRDFQLNLYGRKITTDMFIQNYSGFYIKNSDSYDNYISDKPYAIRSDVKATHMGVSSYYILNHNKFSFGNSFAFVEQQKKSAGSVLFGLYYSYFKASGNPSLISYPFRSSFDTLSLIQSGQSHNFGLNIGYIYTLVFLKNFYTTASFVQGIGAKQMVYIRDNNSTYHQLVGDAGKLNLRVGAGYNSDRFIIGTMAMFDYYYYRGKSISTFDHSNGKFMVYAGYRFSVLRAEQKMLLKLKLIDY